MPLYNNRTPVEVDLSGGTVFPNGLTSLPSGPIEGDEIIVAVDTTPTVWNFKWMSALGGAWVFIGGPPMEATVVTTETTASTSFVDLATVGPSVTVPRAGTYVIGMNARIQNNTAGDGGIVAPTSTTLGAASGARGIRFDSATAGVAGRVAAFTDVITLGAGETLKLQYQAQTGGTATFSDRRIQLIPYTIT